MEAQLSLVRSALQALYSAHDGVTRKTADIWLQNFRNSSGAWQLYLALLSRPGLAEYEYHFAAHSLKLSCCKTPELLEANMLQGLTGQLVEMLLASVSGGAWPVVGQLSSALAAVAVRAVYWEADALVPQLLSLLAPQVAAAMLADLAGGMGVGGSQARGSAALAAAVGAEATAVFALLQVVSGLPEACAARTVSAHPQRKAQVAAALALDATIVPLLRPTVAGNRALEGAAGAVAVAGAVSMPGHMGLGVGPLRLAPAATVTAAVKLQQSALRRAGLKLLYAWAEQLGVAPRGLEHETELIGCLYEALAICETATLASECLSGLFASCVSQSRAAGDDDYQSDTSSASSGMVLGDAASGALVSGSSRRSNWSQAAGFKKARQGIGGGGGIGGPGSGSGARMTGRMSGAGAVVIAAATVATPERQLANVLLLQRLLDGFQTLLQGAAMVYREQQEQAALMNGGRLELPSKSPHGLTPGAPDCVFWSGWSDRTVLQALCNVLCAAASAVLPGALHGDLTLQAHFNALWPQLMALLGHSDPEVALSCVSFWQDTYLAQLVQACSGPQGQGAAAGQLGPQHSGAVVLHSHLPLLAQLLAGLVSRAALGPEAAATATADARDLPEEVRMVRRELGATMRDLVRLVGLGHVAAFLERMISEHAALLGKAADIIGGAATAAGAAGSAGVDGPVPPWTCLESSLYAANVALCSGGPSGVGSRASYDILGGSNNGSSAAPGVDNAHVASIIAIAAASVVHPASSLKLAGTALTLVGGVASWFSEHPLELARPLEAVLSALASPDEKLARNAATALNRLCIHSGCAALLLGCYAGCVSGLQRLLPGPEVTLRHKPVPGIDMSSRELLVASLMRLACSSGRAQPQHLPPPPSPPSPTQHRQQQPQLQQQLLQVLLQQQQGSPSSHSTRELATWLSRQDSRDVASLSHNSFRDLDGRAVAGMGTLAPQFLLQQLLAPRVVAAVNELERLAAVLDSVLASGALQAHLQLWRLTRQQSIHQHHQHTLSQQQPHVHIHAAQLALPQDVQHCVQHCPQPCHHHLDGHGQLAGQLGHGASQRAPVCQPGSPQELQQLGAVALIAAQRLAGLASMLLFVPLAGQVQDMGAGVSGGRRGPDASHASLKAVGTAAERDIMAGAAAEAVASLVVEVVRAIWPKLMACLRPAALDGGAAIDGAGGGGVCLLLDIFEGAHLLPAACSLLQGALLVVASARSAQQAGRTAHGAVGDLAASELLSCSVCLLGLSHGAEPVLPTGEQLQQQQWPPNLDWPEEPGSGLGPSSTTGAHRGTGLCGQQSARAIWQGPPLCALQLVVGCLPLCGKILAQQQPQALSQQGVVVDGQVAAVVIAEQTVQAACSVVQAACNSLQVQARPGIGRCSQGSLGAAAAGPGGVDPHRLLQVLPVLQALLLHVPQALASSRELLEYIVAATVTAMHCHEPDACRALLDWPQLLLCTTAFAPTTSVSTVAKQPSTFMPGSRSARSAAEVGAGVHDGGGGSSLAALQAACRQAPALERAYAAIAVQLDAPCTCCAPNSLGLVYTKAVAKAGTLTPAPALGSWEPAAAAEGTATGSLGAVLVLSLMVAAAGGMPSDLMLPISTCLHGAWAAMGRARFRAWLRMAAVDLSSPLAAAGVSRGRMMGFVSVSGDIGGHLAASAVTTPWARLKSDSLTAALDELWSEECERDVMKLKRSLKALCGGKKKGAGSG